MIDVPTPESVICLFICYKMEKPQSLTWCAGKKKKALEPTEVDSPIFGDETPCSDL